MEESRRESRLPTSSKPSSRPRLERNVSPRSCVRNVSQYLIRNSPSMSRFLFSTAMVLGIFQDEVGLPCSAGGFAQDLFDAVHQVLWAERFGNVVIHLGDMQAQHLVDALCFGG